MPFPPENNPWPQIRAKRIRQLLPQAMDRAGVDAWLVVARENDNDPLAIHVGAENAGRTAGFLFLRDSAAVRSIAISPAGEATALRDVGLHDSVIEVDRNANIWTHLAREIAAADPARIAINSSEQLAAADGLSHTQRAALEAALGPDLSTRLVPAEALVIEWLAIKLPEEVEILRRAAALSDQLQREAYARVVPGRSRDADVARDLKRRMKELGVEDAWSPEQNPNVNSGPDRGHSHATDRIIRPGDFIQIDFGIRVWGLWVTDIQRFAYVLGPGEDQPPADALERWAHAKAGSRAAFEAMRPGVTGHAVDRAQRRVMAERGSLPVMWNTGHPVGYWAHDVGPSLGGAQPGRTPTGAQRRVLRPGQVFAFDGFFSWRLRDGTGRSKTISVEEMAVVTENGAEWLIPPQEELILIGR